MKRLLSITFVACTLVNLTTASVAAKDKWINLRTKNFNIVGNVSEDDARQLALKLEQFRVIISKLTNTPEITRIPITVLLFKSDGSFKPFKPLYNDKPANVSGFFQQSEDENLIALDMNAREEYPMALIFHEYMHLLTAYTPSAWPLWLKEGLAEFYSTFDVKNNEVLIGRPLSRHVLLLRENKFVPFKTLFSVGHDSSVYNEREKQGIFYAESWALAHYLMFGNNHARQPQITRFLALLSGGAKVEEAFTEAFKTDFLTMEKELRRYVGNDSYPGMLYRLKSTEGEKEVSIRPLSDAEVQYNLGNLLMRINRLDDAETYFSQSTALDAGLAGPHEGRGLIAMRRKKYQEAKGHFRQASALGSQNHLVHYYYAEAIQLELQGNRGVSFILSDIARTMIDELKTAIKLMPGFGAAYNLLGFVYLVTGENISEGVEVMKTAVNLEPQNKAFALTLAELQLRLKDYAGARKTLEPLVTGDDEPGVRTQAQSLMGMVDSSLRRDSNAGTFSPGHSASESAEPGVGPRLKRKADGTADRLGPAGGKTDRGVPSDGPTMKLEGTEVVAGTLEAIECNRGGMVLAFKSGDSLLRFMVSDPVELQFFTRDPQFNPKIGCGPINLAAYVHFKPVTGGKFAGDAVAVEFTK